MSAIVLDKKPSDEILFRIAPPSARHYGVLPVDLSADKQTLHVVANHQITESSLEDLFQDIRCKVVVDKVITDGMYEKAFEVFYKDLMPN